jgi:hypothetical protein
MGTEHEEIRIRGQNMLVPAIRICDKVTIVTGRFIKLAQVKDEELVEGEVVAIPERFVSLLKQSGLHADIFTFAERPPQTTPRFDYHVEWDNWAAVRITTFREWWEGLPQESRKNVRRAERRGVVVRSVPFSDELVSGIERIYNETAVRQGRRFWHFGKDFGSVKAENGTYGERSEFIGAFLRDELIGFVKIVYVDDIAILIQIISMDQQRDKRPMNALLAQTVEVCARRRISLLVYGKYSYGRKKESSLAEFKRRNGFEELRFPRYYVPLGAKGKLAIMSGLHLGVSNLVPSGIVWFLLQCRSRYYRLWPQFRPAIGNGDLSGGDV